MTNVQACFYNGDAISMHVAKQVGQVYGASIQPHTLLDPERPFIFLNSSNYYHHRTLRFVRAIPNLDAYLHVDCHDDIALVSDPVEEITYANFVHEILRLGKTIVFVGQRYWSHEVSFKGKQEIFRLRNNLSKYKPIDHIFFLEQPGPYTFCILHAFENTAAIVQDACNSSNIENIYIVKELSARVKPHHKIETFLRTELCLPPGFAGLVDTDPNQYPALVFRWRGCVLDQLGPGNAYVSIDLDVLRSDLVKCDSPADRYCRLAVDDLLQILDAAQETYTIVGGDICGIGDVKHQPTLDVIAAIFEKLRYCMDKSFKDRGPRGDLE